MDTISSRSYRGNLGGHNETSWQSPNTGKTSASGHPAFEARASVPGRSSGSGRISKLRSALASSLPEERARGIKSQAAHGPTPTFVGQAKENLGAHFGERPLGSWLFDGSLDLETDRSDRAQEFPSEL